MSPIFCTVLPFAHGRIVSLTSDISLVHPWYILADTSHRVGAAGATGAAGAAGRQDLCRGRVWMQRRRKRSTGAENLGKRYITIPSMPLISMSCCHAVMLCSCFDGVQLEQLQNSCIFCISCEGRFVRSRNQLLWMNSAQVPLLC